MKLSVSKKQQIRTMIKYFEKANQKHTELFEWFKDKGVDMTNFDDNTSDASKGLVDQIIDSTTYSFDADYLINYIETEVDV